MWTKAADEILDLAANCQRINDSGHQPKMTSLAAPTDATNSSHIPSYQSNGPYLFEH